MKQTAVAMVLFLLAVPSMYGCSSNAVDGAKATVPAQSLASNPITKRVFLIEVVDTTAMNAKTLEEFRGKTYEIEFKLTRGELGPAYEWSYKNGPPLPSNKDVRFKFGADNKLHVTIKNEDPQLQLRMQYLYWKRHPRLSKPAHLNWRIGPLPNNGVANKKFTIEDDGAAVGDWEFGIILTSAEGVFVADPTIAEEPPPNPMSPDSTEVRR